MSDTLPLDLAPACGDAVLDCERLDVYRVALEYQLIASKFLPRRGYANLRDQLERASTSIVLNIAEGAGRFSPADKARLYTIARASAMESAAIVDVVLPRGLVALANARRARSLLVRIIQMLTRLNVRLNA